MNEDKLARYEAVLKRIADPDDECHCGTGGPWQDLAQEALGFVTTDGGDWYAEDGHRMTIDEMILKAKNEKE